MRITPTTRISLGLVSLTISLLLLGKILGLAPDRTSAVVDSRKTLSEALAIQFSAAAQHGDLTLIRETLESMVERESWSILPLQRVLSEKVPEKINCAIIGIE